MFHTLDIPQSLKKLSSSEKGLDSNEVKTRLNKYGLNELKEPPKDPIWKKFLEQFKDFLIIILVVAVLISALLGEWIDAGAILVILIVNAVLGFVQEYRAEKALEALKKMSADYAKVMRNGQIEKISVARIVPGDIFLLEAGDKIPADGRMIKSINLKVSESILTGESEALHKTEKVMKEEKVHLGDMRNIVFKDTVVMFGRGKVMAYATGMNTEVGKIAKKLISTEADVSPLSKELDQTGKKIAVAILIICTLVFGLSLLLKTAGVLEIFLTSISLAVAAIPEGLPAVVTIVLALGIKRLAQQNAIMKKLHAVETLGSTTHICSDKTGTLTQNTMVVTNIWTSMVEYFVSGEKYVPEGVFTRDGKEVKKVLDDASLNLLLKIGALCNDSQTRFHEEEKNWELLGDPTEGALVTVAKKAGLQLDKLYEEEPRIAEIPFSSERAMMTTIHQVEKNYYAYVKGAPEKVLEKCAFIYKNQKVVKMTQQDRDEVEGMIRGMSENALRELAFAFKKVTKDQTENTLDKASKIESDLVFVGIMGQKDPLREQVPNAIKDCKRAGIRPIMITGDHYLTAFAIAKELGLVEKESEVVEGRVLIDMTDEELKISLQTTSVFARVLPKDKLRIVNILKKDTDKVVAVTGDGVNDSLAIKAADIGIAMGIEGTDVTREVADMVLQDDNFATIVKAVRQGRVVFANLVKFIRYLLSCNISEVLVVFLAVLMGFPLPLLPIQLLWVNLITDGLPALALGVDPPEKGVMGRSPRDLREGILSYRRWLEMIVEGTVMALCVFFVFSRFDSMQNIEVARTATFVTLCIIQLLHSLSSRSDYYSIFQLGVFSNKYLLGAIGASFLLQMLVVYTSLGNTIFKAVPLSLNNWEWIMVVSFVPFVGMEVMKFLKRREIF